MSLGGSSTSDDDSSSIEASSSMDQRIYVGGMDPCRGLEPLDVLKRLESRMSDANILLKDLNTGNTYFQFTAVVSGDDPQPLAIIKSWFNNVTWKGCKLIVEEAQPHFLQRLEKERSSSAVETKMPVNESPGDKNEKRVLIPRHWKVKRGFGEPVHHVDTQPCEVKDWAMLSRIRKRHEIQQQKEHQKEQKLKQSSTQSVKGDTVKAAQKLSYYNRSIHLRFSANEHVEPTKLLHSVDESSSDSNFSSDEESVQEQTTTLEKAESKYVWSDDDSSASSTFEIAAQSTPPELENETIPRTKPLKQFENQLDEFASAMEETREMSRSDSAVDESWSKPDDISIADDKDQGLQQDVEANLNVLSKLFPEFSRHQPEETIADVPKKLQRATTSGWGTTGQMLRFDPSNPDSSNQFVLPTESGTTKKDEPLEASAKDNIESSDSSSAESDQSVEMKNVERGSSDAEESASNQYRKRQQSLEEPVEDAIYEQGKLEEVFKTAREPLEETVISTPTITTNGGFSFGFSIVDSADSTDTATRSAFSFSFPVDDRESNDADKSSTVHPAAVTDSIEDTGTNIVVDTERKRCFAAPNEEELDECVRQFYYDMHDGARIIRNPQAWREDPEVKEQWLKERFILTQDWKRKRKYALSKKKRRLR